MDGLKELISRGESSKLQFKEKFPGQLKIAEEMIAFANSRGGTIVFGVKDKTGEIVGLDYEEVQHISNEIANAANEQIRPTIYVETRTENIDGKTILAVDVAEGINKPYKNLQGVIYVKQGPDKRRITENMEILRLFHESRQYFPDEEPVYGTGAKDIYDKALNRFLYKAFKKTKDEFDIPVETLERNLRIIAADGQMTLAGLLFFAEHPEYYRPQFIIKAVAFVGNNIGGTQYRDSKDIMGDMVYVYEEAMRFCEGNLHHIQAGQSFNSLGVLEVSRIALEELIQNALTHRSYLVDAPIRLLIFDDRIEIINPGALAGRLTVENIKFGESYQRNPLLSSFCARGMNYRGLGSGIVRALQDGADIEFVNNEDTNTFKAILRRKDLSTEESGKKSGKITDDGCMKTDGGCMNTVDAPDATCEVSHPLSTLQATNQAADQVANQATDQVTDQVGALLNVMQDRYYTVKELMALLSLRQRRNFMVLYLSPAISKRLVEPQYPDQPRHPRQKYRLTAKGHALLSQLNAKGGEQ